MHTLTTDVDDLYANQRRAVAFQAQHRAAGSQVPAYRLVLETDVRACAYEHFENTIKQHHMGRQTSLEINILSQSNNRATIWVKITHPRIHTLK